MGREVIVIGDKVLVKPEEENAKTPSGLYLPQGVAQKEQVAGGYVVNVGPGYPTAEPLADSEPWSGGTRPVARDGWPGGEGGGAHRWFWFPNRRSLMADSFGARSTLSV
ncbi:MAG TPA: co-chaperone GroES family protein, partial [Longimicrobium sp.]